MKFLTLALVLSLIFNSAAYGVDVWVTTPAAVSPEKMNLILKNLPPELKDAEIQSFNEKELRNPASVKDREKLENTLVDAQIQESKKNYGLAIQAHEQALTQLEKMPNVLGLQNVTFSEMLRLAHLYDLVGDKNKSEAFWKKSYAWNSKADLPDEALPAGVIKKYKSLKPHSKLTQVKIKTPKYSVVFFDGKKSNSTDLQVLTGKHQIAVLVPGSLWQVENIRLNTPSGKPLVYVFKEKPVAGGDCENPKVNDLKLPAQTRLLVAFEKENCNRVFDGDAWYSVDGQRVNREASVNQRLMAQLPPKKEGWFTKMTKSPWFWLGVSVAAVGTYAAIKNHQTQTVPNDRGMDSGH